MTTFTDNFNRADSSSLGANWAIVSATTIGIKSNACYFGNDFGAGESHKARYIGDTTGADNYAEGTITSLSGGYADARLMARYQSGADTCYELRRANDGTWALARRVAGVDTDIASGSLAMSLPETWRVEVSGTGATVTITIKRGGVTIDTVSDTNAARITSGTRGGLGGYGASGVVDVKIDDFTIADLGAGGTNATATPAVIAAVASIPTPTGSAGGTTTPSTISATIAIPTPTVTVDGSATATPATIAVTTAIPQASGSVGVTAAPATVAATAAMPALSGATSSTAEPATVDTTVAIPMPTVTVNGSATATPATIAVTTSILTPQGSVGVTVTPSTAALTVTIPAPSLSAGAGATPATIPLVVSIRTPSTSGGSGVPGPNARPPLSGTITTSTQAGTVTAVTSAGTVSPTTLSGDLNG